MNPSRSLTQAIVYSRDGCGGISKKHLVCNTAGLSVCAPESWTPAAEEPLTTYSGSLLIFPVHCHHVREAGLHVILLGVPITSLVYSLNDLENGEPNAPLTTTGTAPRVHNPFRSPGNIVDVCENQKGKKMNTHQPVFYSSLYQCNS